MIRFYLQKDLTEKEKRGSVDRFKNSGDVTPALIVKLILVFVLLLTAAFVSGVLIGKNGRRNIDRTSSDEEGINEKLSNCIFNSDELRGKYLKLRDAAREKGLIDENDIINMKIICSAGEQNPVEKITENVQTEPVQTFHETSLQEKPKPAETPEPEKPVEKPAETKPSENVQTEPVKTFHETSLQEKPKPAETKPAESRTIDDILKEKSASADLKKEKKCSFSIQIASLDSPEQIAASRKQFKSLKLRVVNSESNGKKLFKLRTGCFDSREAAEDELPKVKKIKKDAFIVSE